MIPGFVNKTLDVRTSDGLNDILLEPLVFVRMNGTVVRAPIGGGTNGVSIPRCLQSIVPPTGGNWFSGVIHDSAYRDELEIVDEFGEWVKAHYTQEECDYLILEAMISKNVNVIEREMIYHALRMFGEEAFKECRKL